VKEISDGRVAQFEDLAVDSIKEIRALFAYKGEQPIYLQKAKVACAVISAYARIRASETNRMAVELTAERIGTLPAPKKALPARS